ncbi:cytochrome P450 [Amylocystis lapponica]|nr:cytochrome P450 [Amylocystis lapponica]
MGVLVTVLGLVVAYIVWLQLNKPRNRALPPGPKPLPIVGNIREFMGGAELWTSVNKVAKQYGDVFYMHVFGQGLAFLNTYDGAVELMERRGALYSDKPPMIMVGELCGCENMVAFTRYGDKSRRYRRLMNQALSVAAVRTYQPLLEIETQQLLKRLLTHPDQFSANVARYAGTLTLLTVYGYRVTSNDDFFLKLADECVALLANRIAGGGGIWPVDIFPVLKRLPLWAPGAGFLRNAQIWKAKMEEMVDRPYELVKERMTDGTAIPCFCTTLLDDIQDKDDQAAAAQRDKDIRWVASSIYASSIDTTLTVMSHFLLAMMEYPEALAKARKEIDTVVGPNRLPTFSDRPSLPYLECVMSETLRWGIPVPLGLPHRLTEDDVYNGQFIPKGTLVFANIWNMLKDEELFPNADKFIPERFMEEVDEATAKRRDPRNYAFGFGRRKCPGIHLVEQSLWIAMACMIATLNMKKATDEQGNAIEPEIKFPNAVFRVPGPFKSDIRPRSEQALKVIQASDSA